ncbi:MAG: hypothetical protein ACJAS1_002759 [Oleiphilaceae bacterium]
MLTYHRCRHVADIPTPHFILIFSDTYVDRVFVIEHDWQFRILYPISTTPLGVTPPFLGVAYANKSAIDAAGVTVEEIAAHEAKHIQQFWELGLEYFGTETWKLEGVAEYVRGKPTADLCQPKEGEDTNRLNYRDYFIAVTYLIEKEGLTEKEIYETSQYPIELATSWVLNNQCKST